MNTELDFNTEPTDSRQGTKDYIIKVDGMYIAPSRFDGAEYALQMDREGCVRLANTDEVFKLIKNLISKNWVRDFKVECLYVQVDSWFIVNPNKN